MDQQIATDESGLATPSCASMALMHLDSASHIFALLSSGSLARPCVSLSVLEGTREMVDKKMEVQLVRASEFSESLGRSRSMEPSGPRLPPTHVSKCAPACDEGEEHAWSAGPTAEAVTGEMANHNVVIQEIGDFLSHHCSNTIGAVNVGVSDFAGATAAVTTTALQVAGIGGIETSGDANKHERTTIPKTAMRVFTNGTAF